LSAVVVFLAGTLVGLLVVVLGALVVVVGLLVVGRLVVGLLVVVRRVVVGRLVVVGLLVVGLRVVGLLVVTDGKVDGLGLKTMGGLVVGTGLISDILLSTEPPGLNIGTELVSSHNPGNSFEHLVPRGQSEHPRPCLYICPLIKFPLGP